MNMTPRIIVIGSLLILGVIVFMVVVVPYATRIEAPSDIFRSRTIRETDGRSIYIANGCVYCHTQSIRSVDWGLGAERIAQAGDYIQDRPILLGSERTGPDLSQEGGEHPDDWHMAHFINPRYTRPLSIMPAFAFLGKQDIKKLTTYVQSLGLKNADHRLERQRFWKKEAIKAYEMGPEANVKWLRNTV
ncbi:MAG: cbb3-type cytochrome c oxidase subunit II, partial [Deltaproteobacteria bacterium]|nr:cbb3-type cytochrome c oxidase subunit II [Deltaproteobacteria bacterium]